MARIVLGIGTSHTPLLCLTAEQWEERAANDRVNKNLYDHDGVRRTYGELLEAAGDRFAEIASPSRWNEKAEKAQASLDALAALLDEASPDVVVIVGDDQKELFSAANLPAIAIYYGQIAITHPYPHSDNPLDKWKQIVAPGYAMDEPREFRAAPELARELIERLVDDGFDVGAAASVPDPVRAGFGHAYGFVLTRLMRRKVPIVPVLLNTYYPPNQPTPARCFALGAALRRAIDAHPVDLRVAIVASGGLSHFVTNEELDRTVLDALGSDDRSALARIPAKLLNDGSSEIRNWIAVGGALDGMRTRAMDYYPVYRTPAGTGIGLGFAAFS